MTRHAGGVRTTSSPQVQGGGSLGKAQAHHPHPVSPPCVSRAATSSLPPGPASGKRQHREDDGKWKMTAGRRQTTAPPTRPGLQEGASAPASWGLRAPAPVVAHGPSEGSARVLLPLRGRGRRTAAMPQAQGGLFHAPSIPRVCARRGAGVEGAEEAGREASE